VDVPEYLMEGITMLLPMLSKWMKRDMQNRWQATHTNFKGKLGDLKKYHKKLINAKRSNAKRKLKEQGRSAQKKAPKRLSEERAKAAPPKKPRAVANSVLPQKDEITDKALHKVYRTLPLSTGSVSPNSSPSTVRSSSSEREEPMLPPIKIKIIKQAKTVQKAQYDEEDKAELESLFGTQQSRRGRTVRPSAKAADLVGDVVVRRGKPTSDARPGSKSFISQFSQEEQQQIREANAAADRESVLTERSNKNNGSVAPSITIPTAQQPPRAKKGATPKQRIAKKLKLHLKYAR
jgi:hypothetical protein